MHSSFDSRNRPSIRHRSIPSFNMLAPRFYKGPPQPRPRLVKRRKLALAQQPVLQQSLWHESMPSFVLESRCPTDGTEGNSLDRAERHYDANIHTGSTKQTKTSTREKSTEPIRSARDSTPDSSIPELQTPEDPASQEPVDMTVQSRDGTPDSVIDWSTAELNANLQASHMSAESHNKSGISILSSHVRFGSYYSSGWREKW